MEWLFSPLWNFIQTQIKNALLDICQQIMTLIAAGTANFWNDPMIKAFLSFSQWANMVVFTVSVIFMLFDIGEELASGKGVDYGIVFTNILKALLFVSLNSTLAQMAMLLSDTVTTKLDFKITTKASNIFDTLNAAYSGSLPFLIVMLIVILIACLVFFVMAVMRYGSMFVLILSSSFYITDILRGDTTSLGSWLRQMIAVAGTYIFQYITFYLGLYYLVQNNIVMCAVCWAGMGNAGKVLQKFGFSSGTKGVFSTASSMASQGISFLASKV